jgi:hypothetical protein
MTRDTLPFLSRYATRERLDAMARRLAGYATLGIPVGAVVLALIVGVIQGPAAAVLVLAASALIAVIAIFWASVRTLLGETPLSGADAYALGAPRAEEEQKRAILRALKDLDFERSVGKISDEDHKALTSKYRNEAKRLLRLLDEEAQPRRERAEAMVLRRLRKEGLVDQIDAPYRAAPPRTGEARTEMKSKPGRVAEPAARAPEAERATDDAPDSPEPLVASATPTPDPPAVRREKRASEETESPLLACPSCRTINDPDAVFCKKCGTRRAATGASDESEVG